MKARLQGNAGNYRFRGAVWELGSFAYRAYVHLIPNAARSHLHRSILSADGMTMQEVVGAAKARVKYMAGSPVEKFELVPSGVRTHQHSELRRQPLAPRRYPPPTD
jgi:hypothetical protein